MSEYNTLMVEEDTPLVQQPKTNNRVKLAVGAIGLGALGLMAGGAIGGHFVSQSQNEEASSNDPDWVKAMSKKSKDSSDGGNPWCPTIHDLVQVQVGDDVVKTQDTNLFKAQYTDDYDPSAERYAFARCTEDCCNKYGDVSAFNRDFDENNLRNFCQAGCIQTVSDTCIDVQAAHNEEKNKWPFDLPIPSNPTFQSSGDEQVSAQYAGGEFSCPEVICGEKKYTKSNCELFCAGGYWLDGTAAVLSERIYSIDERDGKKKSRSTESPPREISQQYYYSSKFVIDVQGTLGPVHEVEESMDVGEDCQDCGPIGFSISLSPAIMFPFPDVPTYFDDFFEVCVDACKSGCDYIEEYHRYGNKNVRRFGDY